MSTTQVSDAMRVTTSLDATKLTGNLPAISGASLTGNIGAIIQIKQTITSTHTSTTGTTPVSTPCTVTITKQEATSAILVQTSGSLSGFQYGAAFIYDDVNGVHRNSGTATHTHGNASGDPYGYFAENRLITNIGAGSHTFTIYLSAYGAGTAHTPGSVTAQNIIIVTEIRAGVLT